jgi:hypothetical protein
MRWLGLGITGILVMGGLSTPPRHPAGGCRTREQVQVFQLSQRQLWHSVVFGTTNAKRCLCLNCLVLNVKQMSSGY